MTSSNEVMGRMPPADQTRSRLTLLLVFGLFAAPVVFAWLAFFVFEDWRPSGTSNHGELIEPPVLLRFAPLPVVEGAPLDEAFLQGKWTYVLWAGAACGKPCHEQLYLMRQLRLAQGKNIDRIQRLLLVQGMDEAGRQELQAHYPGLVIAHGSAAELRGLASQFQPQQAAPEAGRLYLVDPMGNLMMHYAPGDEPKGIVKDLERLLKISYVG
jgi:hypothetical protein